MSDPTATPAPVTTIKVKNFVDGPKARTDIQFSYADLSTAFQEHASLNLHYHEARALATRQVADLKIALEAAEAVVYRDLRDKYITASQKFTEAQLEKEVSAHPKIRQIKLAINEARQIEDNAKGVVESFGHRKDMLVQAGAKDRVELSGELRMQEIAERNNAVGTGIVEKRRAMLAGQPS
jgi:hypothetical protein